MDKALPTVLEEVLEAQQEHLCKTAMSEDVKDSFRIPWPFLCIGLDYSGAFQ